MVVAGRIVVLNGTPRSGKSSIVAALQDRLDGVWMNLGVDVFARQVTPPRLQPGVGLRPGGGERPDIEALVPAFYAALYDSVVAHSDAGLDVVVDVGHHDAYSRPLHVLPAVARRLAGRSAYLIGVRCPRDVVVERRAASPGHYATDGAVVELWEREVHRPGIYDLEVDTSAATPTALASTIVARLDVGPPTAFATIARGPDPPTS